MMLVSVQSKFLFPKITKKLHKKSFVEIVKITTLRTKNKTDVSSMFNCGTVISI